MVKIKNKKDKEKIPSGWPKEAPWKPKSQKEVDDIIEKRWREALKRLEELERGTRPSKKFLDIQIVI